MKLGPPKSSVGFAVAVAAAAIVGALAVVGAISLIRSEKPAAKTVDAVRSAERANAPIDLDNVWYLFGDSPLRCIPTAEAMGREIGPDEFVAITPRKVGAKIVSRSDTEVQVATRGDENPMVFLRGLANCEATHIAYLKQEGAE